jgi:hypothetical protein
VERGASAGTSGATSAGRPATPDAGGGGGHTADSHDASAAGANAAPTAGGMASDALASVTCKPSGVREVHGSHLLIHCSTKLTLNSHSVEYLALPTQAAYGVSARTLQLAMLAMLNDLELEVSVTPSGAGNSSGCALENCRTIRAFSITK